MTLSSHYLQLGLILIVVSVLLIDGIAILSHSNLFESTTSTSSNDGTSRHLRQQDDQNTVDEAAPVSSEELYFRLPSTSSIVNEPKIVWLMSFPNSGTSYTSQLVRDTTYTVSASNYADETPSGQEGFLEPVYEDQIQGPFWIRPEDTPIDYEEPSQYILTKVRNQTSHCSTIFSFETLYVVCV
jgi:hypothetical protein